MKESDRIKATVAGLSKLGADIRETADGMEITGPNDLFGTEVESYGDHRIAMTNAIAGLLAKGDTIIQDAEVASVSYPSFWETIDRLQN